MPFVLQEHLKEKILSQYQRNMSQYPQKQAEVEQWLLNKSECCSLCLKFLYGHMPFIDIVSFSVETIASYVTAALQAYEQIPYVRTIPQDIFLTYVVSHRVNSECLDGSRHTLQEMILPHITKKSMHDAALAVNYWCYSQATYTPSDDRTLGPLSIMRRALGRCGEESVLCVAAMRSVGIPARQCYAPRWSHCDDNHAWVEVWIDGKWHYMGACEPEPILNKGWFTAASSRAMLVHTKCWSDFEESPNVTYTTPMYGRVNCTATYADTKVLRVQVSENGMPVSGVKVRFQIDNYSELFTLYEDTTDENGWARFETGLGDLCVYVCHRDKMYLQKIDMRMQDCVVLDLADSYAVDALPDTIAMDLVAPFGRSDVVAETENAEHTSRLAACEAIRNGFKNTFWNRDNGTVSDRSRKEAAGNLPEIQRFLDDDRYDRFQKEQLLSTLRTKDFVDITCQVLLDALDHAEPFRNQYPEAIFRDYILAPRIADEMLLPERSKIRNLFPEGFQNATAVLQWMQDHMEILTDRSTYAHYPSAYGCLYYRQTGQYCFDMIFVAVCRAFGFPARLAPDTKEGQWLDESGYWHSIRVMEDVPTVTLTLKNNTGKKLNYFEHFSIGYWNGRDFDSLQYWDLSMEESYDFPVRPGLCRLVTTTRQIDGTASVLLKHIYIDKDMTLELTLPEDQTARRLRSDTILPALADGPVKRYLESTMGGRRILVFADPGSEPTEHLLQEMLECADGFHKDRVDVQIFLRRQEDTKDPTLQKVLSRLPNVRASVAVDPEAEATLHRLMKVGDLRLPFVVSVDAQDRGVYATANYNIRMAQTLLLIQRLISGGNEYD